MHYLFLFTIVVLVPFSKSICQDTVSFKQLYFERNEKHGPNDYYYVDERPFTGIALDKYPDGKIKRKGVYEHGMLNGEYKEWFQNGQIKVVQNYHRGMRIGKLEYWYENGQKRSESRYYMNLPYDTSKQWHQNGQLKIVEYTHLGDTIVMTMDMYYEDGTKRLELRPTHQYSWHRNGHLSQKGKLRNNKPYGLWKKYNENGKLIEKKKY